MLLLFDENVVHGQVAADAHDAQSKENRVASVRLGLSTWSLTRESYSELSAAAGGSGIVRSFRRWRRYAGRWPAPMVSTVVVMKDPAFVPVPLDLVFSNYDVDAEGARLAIGSFTRPRCAVLGSFLDVVLPAGQEAVQVNDEQNCSQVGDGVFLNRQER